MSGELICHGPRPVSRAQLLREAAALATRLPECERLVNLCESRSTFLTAFVASMLRRQPQLLPGTRTPKALAELQASFPSAHTLTDAEVRRLCDETTAEHAGYHNFSPDPGALILTGFTSGSTGVAQPHDKRWAALLGSCRSNGTAIRATLGLAPEAPVAILGTVPVHHMYGIELTVILPLLGGMSVHDERPLFPADVAAALSRMPQPRVLVSTPLHLRALADSDVELPEVALMVSASAPLERSLAERIETRLRAPLLEMFGATETCVFAARRTATGADWRLYDEVQIAPHATGTRVTAPWFASEQQLQDVLVPREGRTFVLQGRNSDLIEVAGKRASLADITRRICAIPGITDAVVYQPDAAAGTANRVAAAVVASNGITEKQIIDVLSAGLDPAFVPRPLVLVNAIPRDALGKVSRARLLEIMAAR